MKRKPRDSAAQEELFAEGGDPVLTARTYAEFKQELERSNCRKCALSAFRTRIVVDRGAPGAPLLVVGEAPGEKEDLEGRAFIGRAGRAFDQAMAAAGLDTNRDMLICNIVKCRPPDNRPPHKSEADACRPFLEKQIALAAPKALVLMGATALRHFDPARKKFSMEREAGKFFLLPAFPGLHCMVLYHPAAMLYNPALKDTLWRHARLLKRFVDRGFKPDPANPGEGAG